MKAWGIADMSVAIVKDGEAIYAKGFGVRDVTTRKPVDEQTLFAMGSNTKLLTAVAAGMLVDEERMDWDAKITDFLPWFQLHDPYATREFTLRDALSHRGGLGRRGDALWYGTGYSREEGLRRVRHVVPISSFRSEFGYQNIMFLAAGEATAAAAGTSSDDAIELRIFRPLDMARSNTSVKGLTQTGNVDQPHEASQEGPNPIPWRDIDNEAPAGSMNSSAAEMARWIEFLLGWGVYRGKRLIDEQTLGTIMSPQTIMENPSDTPTPSRHFNTYGLGVGLSDYKGPPRAAPGDRLLLGSPMVSRRRAGRSRGQSPESLARGSGRWARQAGRQRYVCRSGAGFRPGLVSRLPLDRVLEEPRQPHEGALRLLSGVGTGPPADGRAFRRRVTGVRRGWPVPP